MKRLMFTPDDGPVVTAEEWLRQRLTQEAGHAFISTRLMFCPTINEDDELVPDSWEVYECTVPYRATGGYIGQLSTLSTTEEEVNS